MLRKWMNVALLILVVFALAGYASAATKKQENSQTSSSSSSSSTSGTQTAPSESGSMSHMHHGKMGNMPGMSMNTETVKSLQQALQTNGQDPGAIDGQMGPKTKSALRAYQKANGLKPTGKLDADTAQKLGIQMSGQSTQ
jgi:peptidoglycan hydrolase-like protein with peptidoglycan-binding domain